MKDDNDDQTRSTERATSAAVPEQPDRLEESGQAEVRRMPTADEMPSLGEADGVFYMRKRLTGDGEIPDKTHEDNYVELCRVALNNGYRADEDSARVHQAARSGDGWEVLYAVNVEPNTARG